LATFGIALAMPQGDSSPLSPSGPAVTAFPIVEASVADLQAAYVSGRTARAVTQAHLDRIAAYDKRGPLINSLITVDPRALEEADRLDALLRTTGQLTGSLHGIPVIVKDNIDVAGLPMTSGFQGWKNYHPSEDAPLGPYRVHRARAHASASCRRLMGFPRRAPRAHGETATRWPRRPGFLGTATAIGSPDQPGR
jgi:hypothetical protein